MIGIKSFTLKFFLAFIILPSIYPAFASEQAPALKQEPHPIKKGLNFFHAGLSSNKLSAVLGILSIGLGIGLIKQTLSNRTYKKELNLKNSEVEALKTQNDALKKINKQTNVELETLKARLEETSRKREDILKRIQNTIEALDRVESKAQKLDQGPEKGNVIVTVTSVSIETKISNPYFLRIFLTEALKTGFIKLGRNGRLMISRGFGHTLKKNPSIFLVLKHSMNQLPKIIITQPVVEPGIKNKIICPNKSTMEMVG